MEIANTLDTGTTSKVKKLRYKGRLCAVKMISISKRGNKDISKEILIHESLEHQHILRLLDNYVDGDYHCLILEYVPYSLRMVIEQSVKQNGSGLHPDIAHLMFVQLITAVKYLHSKNICHRDIKPENILIGYNGDIKLTDFGVSTLFFYKKQRRLKSRVGSFEFMAPEVFLGSYNGELADIWACGITLLNILTGVLPWKSATLEDEKYVAYRSLDYHHYVPFGKLHGSVLSLIKGMLCEEKHRYRIVDIESHAWFRRPNPLLGRGGKCENPEYLKNVVEIGNELYFTQPNEIGKGECFVMNSLPTSTSGNVPIHRLYLQGSPGANTRELQEVLDKMLVMAKITAESIIFATTDTRRNKLSGKIVLQAFGENCIATIIKTSGDFGEFKKFLVSVDKHFS